MVIEQYEIVWVNLDPSIGSEANKIRPAVVISPESINKFVKTLVVMPITNTIKDYLAFRFTISNTTVKGQIMLDQVKAVDLSRITSSAGMLNAADIQELKSIINRFYVQ